MSLIVCPTATATVELGSPLALDVTDAEVEFDEAWAPYCIVRITATLPSEAVLADIDPRDDIRVTFTTGQTVNGGTPQSRPHDLYLTRRSIDRATATLRIEATSDESQLIFRDLVDTEPDESARALQASLRSIINNRLAGIGAALDASPATDYDLTRAIRAGNYVRNPKAKNNSTDWSASAGTLSRQTSGGPAGATTFMRITGAATTPRLYYGSNAADWLVHPEGEAIIASIWARCSTAQTVTMHYLSYTSAGVLVRNVSATAAIPANTWTRISITMPLIIAQTITGPVAQLNGTRGSFYMEVPTLAAGATLDGTGLRVSPSTSHLDTDYFDPDTAATAYYGFNAVDLGGWLTSGTSTSYRYPQPAYDRAVDALDQQPGQSDWDFLEGLVAIPGYRLFCDENAVWRLVDPAAWPVSPDHFDIETMQGVNFTEDIYLGNPDAYDGAVVAYEQADSVTYDSSATGFRAKTLRGRLYRPYVGVGVAAAIAARGSGRYLEATFTGIADLNLAPSAEITFERSGVDIFNGIARRVAWSYPSGNTALTPRDLEEA